MSKLTKILLFAMLTIALVYGLLWLRNYIKNKKTPPTPPTTGSAVADAIYGLVNYDIKFS